jgi:hypothetical protein
LWEIEGGGGDALVSVGNTVGGRHRKNGTGTASSTTPAAPAVSAKEVINIDDDEDVNYSYFGSSPNPDPGDYSPGDIATDYVDLFVHSKKVGREYKKDRKILIFYEALTVEKKILLGDSPSQRVDQIYKSYIHDLKCRSRWKLDQIALSVYYLGKHVNELLEARAKKVASRPNAKMEALSVMHEFFMHEVNLNEERRRSSSAATRRTFASNAMNPLPADFVFNPRRVSLLLCMLFHWHYI